MQRPQDLIPAESAILKGLTMRVFGPKTAGNKTAEAVALAKDVALLASVPLVLQLAELPDCLPEILDMLDGGDMLSRVYSSLVGPHLFGDANPRVRAAFEAAVGRGVLLDVGHGLGGFSFKVAESALQQGYLPNTISSGIYGDCADHVVFDLPTTLSKFLNLGISLPEVIRRATEHPARLIGENDLGTLRVGGPADISILQLEAGEFTFVDGQGGTLHGSSKLNPVLPICGGKPLALPADLALTPEAWLVV
jgi:dihydroorotase